MPENLLPIITLTDAPSFFFFFFLRIRHWGILKQVYIDGQTLDGIFADIVVYPHCAFNEL